MPLEIDETELINFFEVLPTEQDPEEKECFGITYFDLQKDGVHLSVSFLLYDLEVYFMLKPENRSEPLLEIEFRGVKNIRVRKDKPSSSPVLEITTHGVLKERLGVETTQIIELEVRPKFRFKVRNWKV